MLGDWPYWLVPYPSDKVNSTRRWLRWFGLGRNACITGTLLYQNHHWLAKRKKETWWDSFTCYHVNYKISFNCLSINCPPDSQNFLSKKKRKEKVIILICGNHSVENSAFPKIRQHTSLGLETPDTGTRVLRLNDWANVGLSFYILLNNLQCVWGQFFYLNPDQVSSEFNSED